MKNLSKVSILMLTFMLSFSVFSFVVKPAEASCVCVFQPGVQYDPANPTAAGKYKFTDDGGQTCEQVYGNGAAHDVACDPYKATLDVGWRIPTFSELIGNIIRLIFFIAGLFALVYLLLGGFEWVQSAGDEKKLESARGKITNAVIGLVVMIAVLSLVIFLEQVVFGGKICLGISCPMNIGFLRIVGN